MGAGYEFGRLHGAVRLRRGAREAWIPAPWVHWDELKLRDLKRRAFEDGLPLKVVVGAAPDLENPWVEGQVCVVLQEPSHDALYLLDRSGAFVPDAEVQLAELVVGTRH